MIQPASRVRASVIAAPLVAGVALWLSRSAFDVGGASDAPRRVAMLPGLPELVGLLLLCGIVGAFIARWLQSAASRVMVPILALVLLLVPYLPWLADWVPVLRLLAGPGRVLLWAIVVGQVLWLVVSDLLSRFRDHATLVPPIGFGLVLFLTTFAASAASIALVNGGELRWPGIGGAAALATLVWVASLALCGSAAAATFAWASACLSVPFLLNSADIVPGSLVALVQAVRHPSGMGAGSIAQGAMAVLFDQEYGILPFAPVLLLGFAGLVSMFRVRTVRAAAIVLGTASLLIVVIAASMDPWWSEEMMPGRTGILLVPLLAPPTAWLYERLRGHTGLRSGAQFLLLTTLSISIVTVGLHDRIHLPQEADGSSSLVEWMSPTWHLWDAAPTYLESAFQDALARSSAWLASFAVAAWLLSRFRPTSLARAALWTTCGAVALFMLTAAGTAALPANGRPARFDLEGRALFPLLESFDPVARPIAVRFDPFSVVSPAELPSIFSLNALPGQRRGRQPVHVLLNARFRLPAGEYEAVVEGSGAPPRATIGLQVGRSGTTLETWPLTASPGSPGRYRFTLPIDADFVGFRTSRPAERTITGFSLRPISVVERRQRFHTAGVRSAASWGQVKAFFHDADAYPEPEGFWVRGQSTTKLTLVKANPHDEKVTLAIHCGLHANLATVSSGRWVERIELVPGTTTTVVVPSVPGERLVRLSISSRDGFVPSAIDRESRDRRSLGVWVAFPPPAP